MDSSLLCTKGSEIVRKAASKDEAGIRHEFFFQPPDAFSRLLLPYLNDQNDCPILYLYLNIACISIPSAICIFLLRPTTHMVGMLYFSINYALFLQRFVLALHYSEHRRLFKPAVGWLNHVAPLIFAPLFGVPSGMYRLHHCVMHHVGNNRHGIDTSSTERWHRANPLHFIAYWTRHVVFGWVEIPAHAAANKRWDLFGLCVATELSYLGICALLWRFNPVATTWVLILPFTVSSFAFMFGNWSQHIFINPEAPRSNYGLAYNCVGCPDNLRSFNDGYHIVHHNNSKLHWKRMPKHMIDTLEEHAEKDALIFLGIGFFEVGMAVFCRQWGVLLRHFARYSKKFAGMSDEELLCVLKDRLEPIRCM